MSFVCFFFPKILLSGSINREGANHSVMVIEYTLGVQKVPPI